MAYPVAEQKIHEDALQKSIDIADAKKSLDIMGPENFVEWFDRADEREEFNLTALYEMYDNPDTREEAKTIYSTVQKGFTAAWGYYNAAQTEGDLVKRKIYHKQFMTIIADLEKNRLGGDYNVGQLLDYYHSQGKMPYLFDPDETSETNAVNRLNELSTYVNNEKNDIRVGLQLADESLNSFRNTMDNSVTWYSGDPAYGEFVENIWPPEYDVIDDTHAFATIDVGTPSAASPRLERAKTWSERVLRGKSEWNEQFEVDIDYLNDFAPSVDDSNVEQFIPSIERLNLLETEAKKFIANSDYGAENAEWILKDLSSYRTQVEDARIKLLELNELSDLVKRQKTLAGG